MDAQLAIVSAAAFLAALYVARAVWRQLRQPDDEAPGCRGCPARKASEATPHRRP